MENFDSIKDIWQKTPADLPSSAEIITEIERSRKKMMRKNMLGVITLTLTFIFIAFIGFYYDFELRTTKAGIIIILISICLGVFFTAGMAKLLIKKADDTLDNTSYLERLKALQTKQRFFQTTGMTVYFILLTTGILLYMYEFAVRDAVFGAVAYSVTLAWIAFNWFYIRKRTIQKQEKLINEQIERIEKLIKGIQKSDLI
jgi:hypothetical protein